MYVVMWALMALLAGLLAGLIGERGSCGRAWDMILDFIGSVAGSGFVQSPWVSPESGLVAVMVVAAVGVAGLIVAQRTSVPGAAEDRSSG
jgi:uncharacterized membrane protein YeaQ/YmgE (transglycosylase-associated protein family)